MPQPGKRVLVVDDEEAIRLPIADALADEGYEVLTAANGAQALAVVRICEPHAVILDLMMPVLNGWGFLEACRREQLCGRTRVLIVSAYHKLAAAAPNELHVDDFLRKPFDLDTLLGAVARLVA